MDDEHCAEDAETVQRYRRMAGNPLLPRDQVEDLVADFDRLLDIAAPEPGLPGLGMPATTRAALSAKEGLLQGLADRLADDLAQPRRGELFERVTSALTAVTDCIDGMRVLERAKNDAEGAATADGFVVMPDSCIGLGPDRGGAEAQSARARYEHRIMTALSDMDELQARTVATIRERLDVEDSGVPWTLMECARAGLDLSGSFEASAQLPDSPLRDLMGRLAADMREANATVRGRDS